MTLDEASLPSLRRNAALGAVALVGALTAACAGAGSPMSVVGGGAAPYTSANAFQPTGYTDKRVDETHFQVRASGDGRTPLQRLQKMAEARAAEIGVEEKLDWFKIESSDASVVCGKKVEGYKGPAAAARHLRTVKLMVAYARTQTDPAFQRVDAAFAAAKAALDADDAPPDVASAAEQDLKQACGAR